MMIHSAATCLLVVLGLAGMAAADEVPAEVDLEANLSPALAVGGCSPSVALMTPATAGGIDLAGGRVEESGLTPCCYSDPCPGWGSQGVSCCAEGCSAWSNKVWCSHTGFIYCPNPCAANGICHSPCGGSDPDCGGCQCNPGGCFDDDDCCPSQGGFCNKGPTEIQGSCVCP